MRYSFRVAAITIWRSGDFFTGVAIVLNYCNRETKDEIYSSKVQFFLRNGIPYLWIKEGDMHNMVLIFHYYFIWVANKGDLQSLKYMSNEVNFNYRNGVSVKFIKKSLKYLNNIIKLSHR